MLVSFLWKRPTDEKPRRYRESTELEDSRASRRQWKRRLDEISEELLKSHGGLTETSIPPATFRTSITEASSQIRRNLPAAGR
jgi:hypothetical protein